MDKKLYPFEKREGEIEFIPRVESTSSARYFLNLKYHRPAVLILRKLVSSISRLLIESGNNEDNDESIRGKYVLAGCNDFLRMTPKHRNPKKKRHLQIFLWYLLPDYLVYLYNSTIRNNREIAEESIRLFLYPNIQSFPIHVQYRFNAIVQRFCQLLRDETTTSARLLYYSCRQTYVSLLNSIGPANTNIRRFFPFPDNVIRIFYPFTRELTKQLLVNMKLIRESCFCRVPSVLKSRFESDISQFSVFGLHMCSKIEEYMRSKGLSLDLLPMVASFSIGYFEYYMRELELFYYDFDSLLNNIDLGLTYMDEGVEYTRCTECDFNHGWSYYLSILKELDKISKLYRHAEENLYSCMNSHHVSINKLIMKSKRGDDHQWLLRHKNLVNKESRRHLIKMIFPDQVKKIKLIINRSKLLVDSFEHVGLANPILLRNGIILQFKDEVACAGPAVFKEWLLLLCQHLFAPQNSLFLSCPHDHRRLFPNPAKVDPQQLKYYGFCGRVIALALMHNLQIGISFDRLFFLQLVGVSRITLEDIRNADPYMYKSCKDILEMDTKFIDSNALGLTFVWESEDEFGSKSKIVELCPGGNSMVVNSMNREEYIELVIQHCFIRSIEEKVKLLIQGLDDVLTRKCRKTFFENIELEDLDHMLLEETICEKEREENNEVVASYSSRRTPFQRIVETTLPLSSLKSVKPLTCKQQSGRFRLRFR